MSCPAHYRRRSPKPVAVALVVLAFVIAATSQHWFSNEPEFFAAARAALYRKSLALSSPTFVSQYPANPKLQFELEQMRLNKVLLPENEILIHRSVLSTAAELSLPPALLWCLFFQESRLNHLSGITQPDGAKGLGQFLPLGFYEINQDLERFSPQNLEALKHVLGKDVRPITADAKHLKSPSSYYFIPTAVVSSAAYLNNRYLHLQDLLFKKKISNYSSELLWLYAALAYNKGTRSVLSFWNQARKKHGKTHVQNLVRNHSLFFKTFDEGHFSKQAMASIWPDDVAPLYADEWETHLKQLKSCAVQTPRNLGSEEG